MQLRFFDYIVLIVAYMFVTTRGDKLMNVLKFNKLSNAIPLNRAGSSALLHALLFVLLLVVLNALAAKIAGMTTDTLKPGRADQKEDKEVGTLQDMATSVKNLIGLDTTEPANSRGQPQSR